MGAYPNDTQVMGENAVGTEIVNTEQAAAWDGHEGDVWTEQADRYDRASRRVWQRFPAAELVATDDRVLDLGCGTGGPTRDVARVASRGSVMGLDLSTRMLELARTRSADQSLDNVTFVRGDAQVFPFEPAGFDVAMSSFGTMFFNDPVAAFTNIGDGVRAGGTLALLAWRTLPENEWLMSLRGALAVGRELPVPPAEAPTPFSLADPARVRRILGAAGFDRIELEPIDEPIEIGADASDALEFAKTMGIVEGLTDGIDAQARATAMSNLASLFEANESAEGVLLASAAWLITARKR
jgi:SAM-dependent methyltransferase